MKKLMPLTLAALLAATPLMAEVAAPAPAPAAPAAKPAAAAAPAKQAPAEPPYVKASFDAWDQKCFKTDSGKDPCQLYQLLKDGQGQPVAELSVFDMPPGAQAAAGANVVAPLETLLTQGVTLSIDNSEAKHYPFSYCSAGGCVARIGLTADELDKLKKGTSAVLIVVPAAAPDKQVILSASLKGFGKGFDEVVAANKAAAGQ